MRRAAIERQDRYLLEQKRRFRRAADIVIDALMAFEEIEAIAVIGSVAKRLWKEVPRFRGGSADVASRSGMSARTSIWLSGLPLSTGLRRCVAPRIWPCATAVQVARSYMSPAIRSRSPDRTSD